MNLNSVSDTRKLGKFENFCTDLEIMASSKLYTYKRRKPTETEQKDVFILNQLWKNQNHEHLFLK
jgi:hypothetical protein